MADGEITATEVKGWFIHFELLVVVAIWAGTFVATKVVLAEVAPALSAVYRYIIASVIIVLVDYRNPERIKPQDYPLIVFLAATGVTFYYLLQHYGINYTNATDAAILISLSPVFIGLISWGLLGERLKAAAIIGLGLALGGCVLVITNGNFAIQPADGRFRGNILILLTAVVWALYSAYGKRLLQVYSARTIIKFTTVIGTILLIPFALGEISRTASFAMSWICFINLVYLGALASVYGYLAWYRGLKALPAVTVGSFLYFRPLLTGIIAAIILQEKVGLYTLLGGVMIILGTYLTARQ